MLSSPPIPFNESMVSDRFWSEEEWDKYLPSPGFITDFVLHLRGIMTPTSFCFWSGVFVVSNILQRDAWLQWFPSPMFANFFIIFVAPPRVCAKTSAVTFGEKLLYKYVKILGDEKLRFLKEPRIYNKATPEGLNEVLKPEERTFCTPDGSILPPLRRGSSATISVGELSNFLGKQKYNTGLTEKLIDLYDCKDRNVEGSRTYQTEVQENVYVTLFGATTKDGLEESIPSVAMGGGFISRLIVDSHETETRWKGRSKPRPVIGGPTQNELLERMAWIARNAHGEYTFSEEANAYYEKRFEEIGELLSSEPNLWKRDMSQRYDIHLVKLSLLLRTQRYVPGNVIELQDIQEADKILMRIFSKNHEVIAEVGVTTYQKGLKRVEKKIIEKNGVTRRQLLHATSPYKGIDAEVLLRMIQQLNQEGKIKIMLNGSEQKYATRNGQEKYYWRGSKKNL
jgi:hypothetical protein